MSERTPGDADTSTATEDIVAAAVKEITDAADETPAGTDEAAPPENAPVNPPEEQSPEGQPEPSEHQDEKQDAAIEATPPRTEPSPQTDDKADLRAARKISQMGDENARLRSALDGFIRKDAARVAANPEEFQRLLSQAADAKDFAYIDNVYKALPPIHQAAAHKQFTEWQQIQQAGETEDQRIARIVEERIAPIAKRDFERQQMERQQQMLDNQKVLDAFQEKHGLTQEQLTELNVQMTPIFAGLRQSMPTAEDSDLLDRAYAAINPEGIAEGANRRAMLEASDRNAAKLVRSPSHQSVPKPVQLSEDEQRVSAAAQRYLRGNTPASEKASA